MEYRIAGEPARIGRELMEEHHEHLLGVRVEFVFMNKTPKSKGRDVWGRAKKIGGLNALLALGPNALPDSYEDQPFDLFVIEVSEEVWDHLKPAAKKALVDHELSHCEIRTDEEGHVSLTIVGHDVTEFEAIVRRHGLWNDDLKDFVETAEQLSLDAIDETGGVVEGGDGLDVSITHNGRTVHTNTETMNRMAAGEVPSGVVS
ncbi:MAG: hypothetical protein M3P49_16430 [Actinomycetota bacterium]|nr:hypothetical protein [Actinomycetota bacterium]